MTAPHDGSELSPKAVRIAGELRQLHGPRALGRAQMHLDAAVNKCDMDQVHLLSEVCHLLR